MSDHGPRLVIEFGDEEFHHSCGLCGQEFGYSRPDEPFEKYAETWERHAMNGTCQPSTGRASGSARGGQA